MAETVDAKTSSRSRRRIVWFWLSNPIASDRKDESEWTRYSDFENEYIEEAYQSQKKQIELNDSIINFDSNTQHKKEDTNIEIPIKREEVDGHQYIRTERFSFPERANKSFVPNAGDMSPFIEQWRQAHLDIVYTFNFLAAADFAAQGILKEGKLLNKEFDAQRMSEMMKNCKNEKEILNCAIHLYTRDSFLFKLVNSTLRNDDFSKVETLGPLCYLIREHLFHADKSNERITLYRGTILTEEMIEEYRQAIGKWIQWSAFTSTTKNRLVAEIYQGNTLFIITVVSGYFTRNITALSQFEDEEEILLTANLHFKIDEVISDPDNKKYLIKIGN